MARAKTEAKAGAASKRKKKSVHKRSRWFAFFLLGLVFALGVAALTFHISASIVHVEHTQVYLPDLPESFDGTTLLFVTDIHLMGVNSPQRAARLMDALADLQPDFLLLGGDYASESLAELSGGSAVESDLATRRLQFMNLIADFPAPMGKFAVAGNHDVGVPGLREALEEGGITLLQNEAVRIVMGDGALTFVGLDDFSTGVRNVQGMGGMVSSGDCVIVLSHSPDAFPAIIASEASDGGRWADLVLSGHTHGGQFRIFGWSPRVPSAYGERYRTGWVQENGHTMLISNGTGCSYVNMRWGANPQAHLIELKCAPAEP